MEFSANTKTIGQSLWLDNIRRDMVTGGGLSKLIAGSGIKGLTSNPSIFEKAILQSSIYEETLNALVAGNANAPEIYEALTVEDIQRAADIFRETYDASGGTDGFVSMEVSPLLANDAEATEFEAERLFKKIGRKNVMIKVPATQEGLIAGLALLKKGVNVNFTLIFSVKRYEKTARTYLEAMVWRRNNGLPLAGVASVASFFVSRIDTAMDRLLEETPAPERKSAAAALKGKIAVSTSLAAYETYLLLFSGPLFRELEAAGAARQRILWASTGVKNPAYKDTLYSDELALDGSVNTLPEAALEAWLDHGHANTEPLEQRTAAAKRRLASLKGLGINMEDVFDKLETDGVEQFERAYNSVISSIEVKRNAALTFGAPPSSNNELPGGDFSETLEKLSASNFAGRLWLKDPELWKKDAAHKKQIAGALGWLDIPYKMLPKTREIESFALEIRREGFTHAVLMGMGGSSLAPEVLRSVFQNPKYPKLLVLDTTDPAQIALARAEIDLKKTLFIFASKSGGTIEPSSQFKYFWELLKKSKTPKPGSQFIAITDKDTGLEKLAKDKKFRKIFINPSDIGGRFSALSYFGLVPAALCGADIRKLLARAINMADLCKTGETAKNPGALLGAMMGALALQGKDKLTLVMPKKLEVFSLWVEQLVAESTGKEGKGVVPVCQEELSEPDKYQSDRFFVRTRLASESEPETEAKLSAVKAAGHPVYEIVLNDPYDLGGEFFRWETATAAAGAVFGINPFDQPNVQEAKILTMNALAKISSGGKLTTPKPDFSSDRLSVFISKTLKNSCDGDCIAKYDDIFWCLFSALKEKEYIGLLAYLPNTPEVDAELKKLRESFKNYTSSATLMSYGPRYLHSSGQLHKGGPDNAFFIILTSQAQKDISIAGEKYTFWQLEMAQAMGDFQALDSKNRRVLRLHLKHPLAKSLSYLSERILKVGRPADNPDSEKTEGEEREMPKTATKTANTKNNTKTNLTNSNEYVVIDHPKNLENITSRHYCVRIGANECNGMDISIDDQPWQNCRHSVGYWWFDWSNFTTGTHQLVARMHKKNGEYLVSKRRRCKVI
ncbi:MAG: bifunctional transaldolase/phosoglucose isomerase [Elusimicrobia bacterium]|nr:bifunctional transaldolase/phosoglucose isomerase [Elusimicrobiota bacterium]